MDAVSYSLTLAIGIVIIFWALWPKEEKNDHDEHHAVGATYILHPDGKQYIGEQVEAHAKDVCMPEAWYAEALASADASSHFQREVTIEIPKHLTLSGKPVNVRLGRQHFIKLSR